MSFQIVIIANKSNPYGISRDVESLRRAFGGIGAQISVHDPLEPPSYCDLAVHLEVPIHVWMPWAATNVLVVNPEWYQAEAWDPLLPRFDRVFLKDSTALAAFRARQPALADRFTLLPWGAAPAGASPVKVGGPLRALWMLGASKNKRAYVPTLVNAWKETYPHLLITAVEALDLSGVEVPANISIRTGPLSDKERAALSQSHPVHVCCSRAEGFGYTAADAEACGAFAILNELPVYRESYGKDVSGVAWLPATEEPEALQVALDAAFRLASNYTEAAARKRRLAATKRFDTFRETCSKFVRPLMLHKRPKTLKHLPPRLDVADCPPISVVTLIYNRKKFFDLACHSLMITDYPKDKIEWIIVDDSDDPAEQNSDAIIAVANKSAPVKVVYIPLKTRTPVAQKRNLGVERATAELILMMDDDDHYPETSFRRRVGWLLNHPWRPNCVACTTIACYDLKRGISSVNTPPLGIPVSQRISEATLAFRKGFWAERGFPVDVVVGEGEEFLRGRELQFLEMPPQQMIVAFSHGKNVSSRRVPTDTEVTPGCFWGFPKQFLIFVHRLAGVEIQEA